MMELDLKSKKVVVTGGSKGIGKAICIDLAKEGADVLINYSRNIEEAEKTLKEVNKYGGKSFIYKADVSKEDEVKKMIDAAIKEFGRVDILVNNAGVIVNSPFLDCSNDDWDKVIGINLNGCRFCSKYAAKNMIKNGSGKIINISSIHDTVSFRNNSPYDTSKAAIKMLTRDLALELSEYGITVNSVSPGSIIVERNSKLLENKELLDLLYDRILLKRIGKPEEVAKVVTFLCSSAASYINGTTIYVDGGFIFKF